MNLLTQARKSQVTRWFFLKKPAPCRKDAGLFSSATEAYIPLLPLIRTATKYFRAHPKAPIPRHEY